MTATAERNVKPSVSPAEEAPSFVTEVAVAAMIKKAIGEVANLHVIRVCRVFGLNYRANVYCKDTGHEEDVIPSTHIAHSYFLTISVDGAVSRCIAEKGSKPLIFS